MAVFKCKMCGGDLEIIEGSSVTECEYCGTKQTVPRLDDDHRANLYDRANHFRRNNDFDKAMGIFESILNEDSTDAEAYWSLVLCRWGIEYVEDPKTRKRVPTVNRAQFTSIFDDEDYKSAIRLADEYQREIYESEAAAINEIQKGILEISGREEPFDVFICYKETDQNGRRTHDSVLATELYNELTREGFKVFFSRITLEDKLGSAYEPYIFSALHSSKAMVVVGTRPEHFNAVWVKNEWSRYLALIKSGARKTLIPAYRDMDPYDLPDEFAHLQAQDMSKLGFMQDLVRGIKKIIGSSQQKAQPKASVVTEAVSTAPAIAPLLKRAFIFLEDGEFDNADEYAEKVLDINPEYAEAYLVKLMVDLKTKRREDLCNLSESFDGNKNYQKVIRFAKTHLADELRGYISAINDRIAKEAEEARKEAVYTDAQNAYDTATLKSEDIPRLQYAVEALSSIEGYKDSSDLARRCETKIAEIQEIIEKERIEAERRAEEKRIAAEKRRIERELERIRVEKNKKKLKLFSLIATPVIILAIVLSVCISNYYESHYKKPTIDGIKYEKISGGYRLVEYVGYDSDVVIPDEVRGKPVIEIDEYAFRNCTSLTSVTIGDSVTTIGDRAFYDCTSLTSVTIPDSVTTIGNLAFYDCTSLTSITIPDSVTTIGYTAFSNCTSLTSVTIPDSVTTIGESAFSSCTSLTSITIPDSVTTIGSSAFSSCTSLTSITIPDSVTAIGDRAFYDCSSLTSVTIPDSVTTIGEDAFYDCDSLTSVTIGDSVTSIGDWAFYDCDSLTSVTIGDSVTSIGDWAFSGCYKLVEVINHSSLYITAGSSSYGNVGYYAKEVHKGESKIVNVGDYLFYTYDGVNYLLGYVGTSTNLILPENYNGENYEIYENAFRNCTSLTSVTIPDSVTSIGSSAFSYCDSLTSITIPDSVTTIGSSAFYHCSGLTSITIPDSVTTIGKYAFYDCSSLTSVTIGDSVTAIGEDTFRNCTSLTSVTIGDSVTTIALYAFYGCSKLTTVINRSNLNIIAGSWSYGYVAYYADKVIKE